MSLSKQSIENLLDLVEIKISTLQVLDREDAREMKCLEGCRDELADMRGQGKALRRRGRPRSAANDAQTVATHH
ncbi:MAG: hypothetical protein GKS01_08860 [Alphaproteobacteria bacterium]|nr:hypothetical protein [Alphaproteobacteria bacterium]